MDAQHQTYFAITIAARTYHQWTIDDSEQVEASFQAYILQNGEGAKGPLPGKKEIEMFILQHPNTLRNEDKITKIKLIRNKIFNERKLARERARKNLNQMME